MAVSLSNDSLLSIRLPISLSKPAKLHLKTLAFQNVPQSTLWLPLSISASNCSRRSAKASMEIDNNWEKDAKTSESETDRNPMLSLKNLIKAYKMAILNRDEKAAADIEAMIHTTETEKNKLAVEVSVLSAEITSGKEKNICLQADFDNFRKRSDKESLTIKNDAVDEVIESLLPVADSFERAKRKMKPETDKEKGIDASYQGIYKQLVEIMRSMRVAAVATVGKPFDPLLHEAVAREESQKFKEGIIIREIRRGFLLGDRLIRRAMVIVSSGSPTRKAPAATHQSQSR